MYFNVVNQSKIDLRSIQVQQIRFREFVIVNQALGRRHRNVPCPSPPAPLPLAAGRAGPRTRAATLGSRAQGSGRATVPLLFGLPAAGPSELFGGVAEARSLRRRAAGRRRNQTSHGTCGSNGEQRRKEPGSALGRAPRIGRCRHSSDQPGQAKIPARLRRGGRCAPRCASADHARSPKTLSP